MLRVAREEQTYSQRPIKVSEAFEVEQADVEVLLRLGRIYPIKGEQGYVASSIGPVAENRMMSPQASQENRPQARQPSQPKLQRGGKQRKAG